MPASMTWLIAILGALAVLVPIAAAIVALGVIPGGRRPSTGMAWLILIIAVPYLGIIAFFFFGSNSVGRKRRAWQREVNAKVLAAVESRTHPDIEAYRGAGDTPYVRGLARLNQNLGSLPMSTGNTVDVFSDYQGAIDAMTAEVERAEHFVHVEFYISAWDEVTDGFFTALSAAVARGVEVRLLFDHLGSRGIPGYQEFLGRLDTNKIVWAAMLPLHPLKGQIRRPDLRNHRKILVVDGRVAFAGSLNMIEPGYDKPGNHKRGLSWVELVTRVTGPVVRELSVVFATDWAAETGEVVEQTLIPGATDPSLSGVTGVECQVVPSGPGFVTENNLRLFNSLLYGARSRVSLTSPYFVPDETLLYAVTTAAQRGVEVELFVSAVADQFMVFHAQRSYYAALLDAGVRIWLYPEPFVLHAKFFTVDDDLAVIGSSNMDYRSFALNYEVVLMLADVGVVDRLRAVHDQYRALSTELDAEAWRRRGWRAAYVDNVMRLTATLQ